MSVKNEQKWTVISMGLIHPIGENISFHWYCRYSKLYVATATAWNKIKRKERNYIVVRFTFVKCGNVCSWKQAQIYIYSTERSGFFYFIFFYSIFSYPLLSDVDHQRSSSFLHGTCHWSVVQFWSDRCLEICVPTNERYCLFILLRHFCFSLGG